MSCSWTISAPASNNVEVTFSFFSLEMGYDFLKIYDGTSTASPQLAALSGTITPAPYRSSGTSLFVQFTSDSSVTAAGFVASYRAVGAGSTPVPITPITPPPVPGTPATPPVPGAACSGQVVLAAATGTITDGPGNYTNGKLCQWRITGSPPIRLTFTAFNTENGYDFVKVYDGISNTATMLGAYSGTLTVPRTVIATSGSMFVQFSSDSSVFRPGFTASFVTGSAAPPIAPPGVATPAPVAIPGVSTPPPVQQGECSGQVTLSSATGSFTDGPNVYSNNALCTWTINAPGPVTLTFQSVNLEANYDFVKIYAGTTTTSPLLNSLTGIVSSTSFTQASGQMLVVFTSDSSIAQTGFTASYTTAGAPAGTPPGPPGAPTPSTPSSPGEVSTGIIPRCAGLVVLTQSSGVISDGTGEYPALTTCQWRVESSVPLTLTFDVLNLERNYDFVRIYSGSQAVPTALLATVTGQLPVSPIITTGTVLVQFTSDSSIQSTGFTLRYGGATRRSMIASNPSAVPVESRNPDSMMIGVVSIAGIALVLIAVAAVYLKKRSRPRRETEMSTRTPKLRLPLECPPAPEGSSPRPSPRRAQYMGSRQSDHIVVV
jgi:hypothetical protein